MLLVATMLVCALVLGRVVLRYDLYDREPWPLVLLAAALGGGAMWACGELQTALIRAFPVFVEAQRWSIPALAALTEEPAKLLVVVLVAWVFPRAFNDPLDGLVYGSLAGLGCAVEESIALLAATDGWLLPGSEVVRLMGHLVMGGIGGFGVGWVALRRPAAWSIAGAAFAGAVALHFVWDVLAWGPGILRPGLTPVRVLAIAVMFAGMAAYRWLALLGAAASKELFAPGLGGEARTGSASLPPSTSR